MWTLLGVGVVIVGFALRVNALLVVITAALVTGLMAGLSAVEVLSAFGKAFNDSRFVSIAWLVLPVIGLLERVGLQEHARSFISRFKAVTTGRLLLLYLAFRQVTAAIGLLSVAGHAQSVKPLIAPMAEAAAEVRNKDISDADREDIRAMSAATDNVGLFFGEDVFLAIGSILLMVGFLAANNIIVAPLELSLWAIPTAIAAFLVHGARLVLLDRNLSGKSAGGRK